MAHTHETADWATHATEALATAGYRRGGARAAVIELLDGQGCALSAFEIEARLAEDGERRVARASVYRILEELEELGLITRLDLGQNLARFEPNRADGHHHHMICDNCGDVFPFEDAGLEQQIERVSKTVAFTVAAHDVVLHGECADCGSPSR